jgi:hypothetical protein
MLRPQSPRVYGKGFDTGPPRVRAGSLSFCSFSHFSLGSRPAVLPFRHYFTVCVPVAVSVAFGSSYFPIEINALFWSRSVAMAGGGGQTSGHLVKHHLATWQQLGDGLGLPDEKEVNKVLSPLVQRWPAMSSKNPSELVLGHIIANDSKAGLRPPELKLGCLRANACEHIWWDPAKVKAAIVTCGGLSPGLNSIIRGVFKALHSEYGVQEVYGWQFGHTDSAIPSNTSLSC